MKLGDGDCEISDVKWRRIVYGWVSPFVLLHIRKNSMLAMLKVSGTRLCTVLSVNPVDEILI